MKNVIAIAVIGLSLGNFTAHSQSTVDKVGNKTAEIASKGAHRIKDKVYRDKVGPNGETVYIDGHSRYYWIDEKGSRQFLTEDQLKDKTAADQTGMEKAGSEIKEGATKVGHKTAQLASKGAHRIKDKVYKDKVGPNGETIYIDNHSRYYSIDEKGKRQFVTEDQLKVKE
ncbi:MAG: hypothetical protein NVSMB67_12840 [Flavisolibacter sp.]